MMVPQNKIKHRIIIWSSNSPSKYTPKGIESEDSNKYLEPIVQSSIIHNSQKVEKIQMFISG